jgi:choline monooxygenase
LTRDRQDQVHCLSNVCTHRAFLLCEGEGVQPNLRCRYHGRRFGLDGCFQSMPGFEGVEGFPSDADNLPQLPLGRWKKFLFTSLEPAFPLEELIADMDARVGWLPVENAVLNPRSSRDCVLRANWALYADNYLEGFHIPYAHEGLNEALDFGQYRTELFRYSSLQVGVARSDERTFDLPRSSPDHGQRIAAYYFWLFPNTTFNFFPWGVRINTALPLAPDLTRLSYRVYVWDHALLERDADSYWTGSTDNPTLREDEVIVEAQHKGVRSRLYQRGRYSPKQETGVHHFHRLLAEFLKAAGPAGRYSPRCSRA